MTGAALEFLAASTFVILLPGPDTLNVLRALLRRGQRQARRTAAGTVTGLAVWAAAAALGISALLRASHDGYDALRIAGGIYLCFIGLQAWLARGATAEIERASDPKRPAPSASKASARGGLVGTGYVGGVVTNLLNPKVGVFFVTFLPAFVPAGDSVGWVSLLFGVAFAVETGLYFVVFLRFADGIVARLSRPRFRKVLDRMTGSILIGFGLRLAIEG